jgi:hypothetical protein
LIQCGNDLVGAYRIGSSLIFSALRSTAISENLYLFVKAESFAEAIREPIYPSTERATMAQQGAVGEKKQL